MGVPSKEELQSAIDKAVAMRETGDDPDHLAKCLLNLNYRLELMENLLKTTKLYLHSGQGGHEHTLLLKAIDKVEAAANDSSDHDQFGLDNE